MNNIEYREHLEELRDAIDDAFSLADRAIWSKRMPGQEPDEAIEEAREKLHDAVNLVAQTIKDCE